jgi:hypothetical protein
MKKLKLSPLKIYKMKTLILALTLINLSSCAFLNPNPNRKQELANQGLTLRPFTTDYCSEWPDGQITDPKLWADCCFAHDLHYWIGGTVDQRKQSDIELKSCVKNFSDSLNGFLMYMGVRMGGDPGNASYAWGYGWTLDRKYFELAPADKLQARELLKTTQHNDDLKEKAIIDNFIEKNL